jgi:Helix-turn-helix domain
MRKLIAWVFMYSLDGLLADEGTEYWQFCFGLPVDRRGGWGSAATRSWLEGRCLTLAQREEIALGRARGQSVRSIAAAIRRAPSTVSRELRRNADRLGGYRATTAHALAYARASRPKPAKLVTNLVLRGKVEADLAKKYSPEQISGRLKVDFPPR